MKRRSVDSSATSAFVAIVTLTLMAYVVTVYVGPWANGTYGVLVDRVKEAVANPSAPTVWKGAGALVCYAALTLLVPFSIVLAYVSAECVLVGRDKDWKGIGRDLWIKSVMLWVKILVGVATLKALSALGPSPEFLGGWSDWFSEQGNWWSNLALAFLAFLFADLGMWIAHFLSHKVPFLWHFHQVHHAIESLEAGRNYTHPVDGFFEFVWTGGVAWTLGFGYEQVVLLTAWRSMHDEFTHTNAPIHLGFLRRWLVDNRYHHFHHSAREEDYDLNFASNFTFWDKIFRTYRDPGDSLVKTGVTGVRQAKNLRQAITGRLDRG